MANKRKDLQAWEAKLDNIVNPNQKGKLQVLSYKDMCAMATLPQRSVFESREQVNLFLAGQGSGKTQAMGLLSIFYLTNFPNAEGMIAANTKLQLSDSTFKRIFETWKSLGYKKYNPKLGKGDYTVNHQPPEGWTDKIFDKWDNKICWSNGAIIYTGSLDNYIAHDGKEVSWILLDETKDTKQEALTEVLIPRLRQIELYVNETNEITNEKTALSRNFNPIYLFTSPAKVAWLNDYFNLEDYEKEIMTSIFSENHFFQKVVGENKFCSISSTYLNHFVNPSYITNQKAALTSELQDMNIYGCPFSRAGGEFYKGFDRTKHIGKCPYNPKLPLHITFDFNVSPYMTLLVWQMDGSYCWQIDEILGRFPKNTTTGVCREFQKKYPAHDAGLFVYGDPAGKARDTRNEEEWNDYTIIMSNLRNYNPKLRLFEKSPSVVGRANFINSIFEKSLYGIVITIDENCAYTIADYTMLKEDADGKKLKKKVKNKSTGVSEEIYGHTSDANDYFLCKAFEQYLFKYQNGDSPRRDIQYGSYKKNKRR